MARFLPNRAKKSLVWLDPVFIVPEIVSEKVAKNLEKMAGVNGLRVGRVSRVLEEEIQNRPIGAGFLTSKPKSNRQSCRIEWIRVRFRQVWRLIWIALIVGILFST